MVATAERGGIVRRQPPVFLESSYATGNRKSIEAGYA